MEIQTTFAAPIVRQFNGKTYTFNRLTMGDFARMAAEIPVKTEDRPFVSISQVLRWLSTPAGCAKAVVTAGLPHQPGMTTADVEAMAGPLDLAELVLVLAGVRIEREAESPLAIAGESRAA